jgi:hypothetical protein
MNAEPAKPAMSAQDSFFEGKLLVEANLGRGFSSHGPGGGGDGANGGQGGGGGHRGRRGGGGGMSMGGGEGGRRGGSGDVGSSDDSPSDASTRGPSIRESSMPPVALRLRLTNHSNETVEVTFVLCKSELGDFAVRPEKLSLAPEQSAEPDPMTSRLGLTSGELVLSVGLRVAGKVEQKILVLKAIAATEPPAGPQP